MIIARLHENSYDYKVWEAEHTVGCLLRSRKYYRRSVRAGRWRHVIASR